MGTLLWILIVLAMLALLWILLISPRKHPPELLEELRGSYFAHRGYHDDDLGLPENSLGAFRRAAQEGFGAELDVHLTHDGRLAVMHDESLQRMCGVDRRICDSSAADLALCRLGGTEEPVPFLEEVLPLFEGKGPLLIELKTCGLNYASLCQAVMKQLDSYKGRYCLESFDPRVVLWLRRNRPDVVRGQLSMNFTRHHEKMNFVLRFILHNLLLNLITAPDFVSYRIEDRNDRSVNLLRRVYDVTEFFWTIRSKEQQRQAEELEGTLIFENFDPRRS